MTHYMILLRCLFVPSHAEWWHLCRGWSTMWPLRPRPTLTVDKRGQWDRCWLRRPRRSRKHFARGLFSSWCKAFSASPGPGDRARHLCKRGTWRSWCWGDRPPNGSWRRRRRRRGKKRHWVFTLERRHFQVWRISLWHKSHLFFTGI